MSPCHGFNGIVEQWKTSSHYQTYLGQVGGTEAEEWTAEGQPCGNCHAIDALKIRVAGTVGTTNGGVVANLANGELGYLDPTTKKLNDSSYVGEAKVPQVNCVTCHDVTNDNDPHRTGKPYADGDFPLRVPVGMNDGAYIEKSPDNTAVVGQSVGNLGPANTCVWCHKGRKDISTYITASNKLTSPYWGPHEGPQADVYSGKGGYHFAGMTYGEATHNQKLTCIDCHMPDVADNDNRANHSFYAQLSACIQCHNDATSFDVNGGESTIAAAMHELQKALNDAGYLTRSAAAPYAPLTDAQLKDGNFELDRTNPNGGADAGVPVLTADQAGALYNYIIISRGGGKGVHNPKYIKQLIFDSYMAITGTAPLSIVRPN